MIVLTPDEGTEFILTVSGVSSAQYGEVAAFVFSFFLLFWMTENFFAGFFGGEPSQNCPCGNSAKIHSKLSSNGSNYATSVKYVDSYLLDRQISL
jgi:hypothetical protein